VFTLHIGQAVFADWDITHGQMTIHRWSSRTGSSLTRSYP